VVEQLGADQREAAPSREQRRVLSLHLPPFPSHCCIFGTARSGQGRAVCARRKKIFSGFEKIFWSGPLTLLEQGRAAFHMVYRIKSGALPFCDTSEKC